MTCSPNCRSFAYGQIAFAPWGSIFRPLIVLNPEVDVPNTIREQLKTFPESFEICYWIGGDIAFLPGKNIIDYDTAVAKGYDKTPLEQSSGPLANGIDRDTQMALHVMQHLISEDPNERVHFVKQSLSVF
jgi:hypothetical protein